MMTRTITKITDTNVALVETVENRRVYSKKELDELLVRQKADVAKTQEMLDALTA